MNFISWCLDNKEWTIPLGITILFSIINVVFAFINAKNAAMQYKAQQMSIGISLMEKRMELYSSERDTLESIINYSKPSQKQIENMCYVDLEARFLFGDDVQQHIKAVMELIDAAGSYKKTRIPDGQGGFFVDFHDHKEEEFSQKASELYGESIDLYGKYIDFSHIVVNSKSKRRARK